MFGLFLVLLAAFAGDTLQRSPNKTLQTNEEDVDLFILDFKAEGTTNRVGCLVKRGTDPTYQVLPDTGTQGLGQLVGFWYPNGHKLAGVYENNPGTAVPAGSDLRICAPQSGVVSVFLLPNGVTVALDERLKPTSSGRVTNLAGTPTVAEALLPGIICLEASTAAADDAFMLGRWA